MYAFTDIDISLNGYCNNPFYAVMINDMSISFESIPWWHEDGLSPGQGN